MILKDIEANTSGVLPLAWSSVQYMLDTEYLLQTLCLHPVTAMFVEPTLTTYAEIEDVPSFNHKVIFVVTLLGMVEMVILWLRRVENGFTIEDYLSGIGVGSLKLPSELVAHFGELHIYAYFHRHFAISTFPWDSHHGWLFPFLVLEFNYYWFHRAQHEINFFWAFHETHHSSEYFNYVTAYRTGFLQRFTWAPFYLVCSLFIPPSTIAVHVQLMFLLQFWYHSHLLPDLPILDNFLQMPSHHRVHHGRNPYCLDKNYGAILTIWDKLFGTYERERPDEEIKYGIVTNIDSYNIYATQIKPCFRPFSKMQSVQGWANKLKCLIYGPGWFPGTPRLGIHENVPEVDDQPVVRYRLKQPTWMLLYVYLKDVFLLAVVYMYLLQNLSNVGVGVSIIKYVTLVVLLCMGSFTATLLLDGHEWAELAESLSYAAMIVYQRIFGFAIEGEITALYSVCAIMMIYWSARGSANDSMKTSVTRKS